MSSATRLLGPENFSGFQETCTMQKTSLVWNSEVVLVLSLFIIATFRSDGEYKIENEYDFRTLKQLRSQSPRFPLLLGSREACYVNDISVTGDNLKPATRNSKLELVLNLVIVVRSEGRYYSQLGELVITPYPTIQAQR